jgi:hypothetical protein
MNVEAGRAQNGSFFAAAAAIDAAANTVAIAAVLHNVIG